MASVTRPPRWRDRHAAGQGLCDDHSYSRRVRRIRAGRAAIPYSSAPSAVPGSARSPPAFRARRAAGGERRVSATLPTHAHRQDRSVAVASRRAARRALVRRHAATQSSESPAGVPGASGRVDARLGPRAPCRGRAYSSPPGRVHALSLPTEAAREDLALTRSTASASSVRRAVAERHVHYHNLPQPARLRTSASGLWLRSPIDSTTAPSGIAEARARQCARSPWLRPAQSRRARAAHPSVRASSDRGVCFATRPRRSSCLGTTTWTSFTAAARSSPRNMDSWQRYRQPIELPRAAPGRRPAASVGSRSSLPGRAPRGGVMPANQPRVEVSIAELAHTERSTSAARPNVDHERPHRALPPEGGVDDVRRAGRRCAGRTLAAHLWRS